MGLGGIWYGALDSQRAELAGPGVFAKVSFPTKMHNNYAPGSHDWCLWTKHAAFANVSLPQKVRSNYAPDSHDWCFCIKHLAFAKVSFPTKYATIMHQAATTGLYQTPYCI